jgi:drug/metabolite transporter (DMT)-like permease
MAMTFVVVILALVAAGCFAVATVAEQHAAYEVPDDSAHGIHLLFTLMRRPLWWGGFGGNIGGFVVQAVALGLGSLLLVQPLLVTALLFALPLGARWNHRHMARADWVWAVLLAVSLAIFVVVGQPTRGMARASITAWLHAAIVIVPCVLACLLWSATRRRRASRALPLAVATGILYGIIAALTKSVASLVGHGAVAVFTNWETYALMVVGILGVVLQQAAFQAGSLEASLPAATVLEPIVATVLGLTILGETLRAGGPALVLIGLCVVVVILGTVALARSAARFTPEPATAPEPATTQPTTS